MSSRMMFRGGALIVLSLACAIFFITSASRTRAQDTPPVKQDSRNNQTTNDVQSLVSPSQPGQSSIQPQSTQANQRQQNQLFPNPVNKPAQVRPPLTNLNTRIPQQTAQPTLRPAPPAQRPSQPVLRHSQIRPNTALPTLNPISPRQSLQGFSQNRSLVARKRSPATDVRNLVRATYKLPADAAESLTQLFGHSATALVECRIEQPEDESSPLVALVVTTEPDTHLAIENFIQMVFPAENLDDFKASTGETIKANSKYVSFIAELPNMTCGGCAKAVMESLKKSEVVFEIKTDAGTRTASFQCAAETDVEDLFARLEQTTRFFGDYKVQRK